LLPLGYCNGLLTGLQDSTIVPTDCFQYCCQRGLFITYVGADLLSPLKSLPWLPISSKSKLNPAPTLRISYQI
jgi:hypothetical protein